MIYSHASHLYRPQMPCKNKPSNFALSRRHTPSLPSIIANNREIHQSPHPKDISLIFKYIKASFFSHNRTATCRREALQNYDREKHQKKCDTLWHSRVAIRPSVWRQQHSEDDPEDGTKGRKDRRSKSKRSKHKAEGTEVR